MSSNNFKQYTEITTHDGTVYRIPGDTNPQLWAVHLSIQPVDMQHGYLSGSRGRSEASIYVTRQVLIDHGLAPAQQGDTPAPTPPETAEDLLLKLLGQVGVFPQ